MPHEGSPGTAAGFVLHPGWHSWLPGRPADRTSQCYTCGDGTHLIFAFNQPSSSHRVCCALQESFRYLKTDVVSALDSTSNSLRMTKWLCGRQVLVLFSVFLTAQLTTFTMETIPFTSMPVPTWMKVVILDVSSLILLSQFGK